MLRSLLYIIILIHAIGCDDFEHYKPLGSNYYFASFGSKNALLYDFRGVSDGGGGVVIVAGRNMEFSFTDQYIILADDNDQNKSYWIIDKYKAIDIKTFESLSENDKLYIFRSNVIGPLDSISFYSHLDREDIRLDF